MYDMLNTISIIKIADIENELYVWLLCDSKPVLL